MPADNISEVVERLEALASLPAGRHFHLRGALALPGEPTFGDLRLLLSHIRKEPGPRGWPTREEVAEQLYAHICKRVLSVETASWGDLPDDEKEYWREDADAILFLFPSPYEAGGGAADADDGPLSVVCPTCGTEPGLACIDIDPPRHVRPHPQRIAWAKKSASPTSSPGEVERLREALNEDDIEGSFSSLVAVRKAAIGLIAALTTPDASGLKGGVE